MVRMTAQRLKLRYSDIGTLHTQGWVLQSDRMEGERGDRFVQRCLRPELRKCLHPPAESNYALSHTVGINEHSNSTHA